MDRNQKTFKNEAWISSFYWYYIVLNISFRSLRHVTKPDVIKFAILYHLSIIYIPLKKRKQAKKIKESKKIKKPWVFICKFDQSSSYINSIGPGRRFRLQLLNTRIGSHGVHIKKRGIPEHEHIVWKRLYFGLKLKDKEKHSRVSYDTVDNLGRIYHGETCLCTFPT